MFQSFVIKNFRCFSGLILNPLERVNLIAGMNNTGKTALLEAIHLHCDPAHGELLIAINRTRDIDRPFQDAKQVGNWLFRGKQVADGLMLQSQDDKGVTRTLTMWLLDGMTARERFPEVEKQLGESFRRDMPHPNLPRIIVRYEQSNEPERTSFGVMGGLGGGKDAPR